MWSFLFLVGGGGNFSVGFGAPVIGLDPLLTTALTFRSVVCAGPNVAALALWLVALKARPAEAKGSNGNAIYQARTGHLIVLSVYRLAVGAKLHHIPNSSGAATTVRQSPLPPSSEQMLGCLACSVHNSAIVSQRREPPKILRQALCKIACRSFAAPVYIFNMRLGFPEQVAICSACANETHPTDLLASTD